MADKIKFGTKTASNTGPVNTPSMQQDPNSILVLLGQNSIKNTDLIEQIVNKIDFKSLVVSVQEISKSVTSIQPFIEDTWANIGDMFDKLKDAKNSAFNTTIDGPSGTINFIIECANGQSYTALREILDIATGNYDEESFSTIDNLIDVFSYVEKLSKEISKMDLQKIDKNTVKSIANLYEISSIMKDIASESSKTIKYVLPVSLFSNQLISFPGTLIDLIGTKQNDKGIAKLSDRISRTKLDMKGISDFISELSSILKDTVKIAALSVLSNKLFVHINKSVEKLNLVIDQINSAKFEDVKNNKSNKLKIVKDNLSFIKSILVDAVLIAPLAILAIPGIVAMRLAFGLITKMQADNINAVSKIVKDEKKVREDNKSFMRMIVGSAFVVLGAAILGGFIWRHAGNIALFTVVLAGFIISMSAVAVLTKVLLGLSKKPTKGSKRKSSIFAKMLGIQQEDDYNSVFDDLSKLVLSAAATLIVGSILISFLNLGNIVLFCTVLLGFISLLSLAVLGVKKLLGSDGIVTFTALGNVILLSTIALGIGALFVKSGLAWYAVIFSFILAATIFAIVGAVALVSKLGGKKMIEGIRGLNTLILIITASLLVGAWFVSDEKRKKSIWQFLGIVGTFIGGLVIMCAILGAANKIIVKGILALAAITIISLLLGIVIKNFAEATAMLPPTFKNKTINADGSRSKTKSGNSMWSVLGAAGAIILGLAGLALALGAIAGTGVGAVILAAGIAALAGIVGVALMVSKAIKNFAEGYQIMVSVASNLKDPKKTTNDLKNLMSNFAQFVKEFAKMGDDIKPRKVKRTANAFNAVIGVVGNSVSVIKDVANLRVPIYDKDGKIVGYNEISETDFSNAIDNTYKVITTLADALIYIYQNGVGAGLGKDLFKNTATLSLITSGIINIVKIVGESASIIKDLADFKYTYIDENGKAHKLVIDDAVLQKVKENIVKVVGCMSSALIDIYSDKNSIFANKQILKMAKKTSDDVFSLISGSVDSLKQIIDLFSTPDSDKAGEKYANTLESIINPFTKETINKAQLRRIKKLSEIDFSSTIDLLTSVNKVDVSKTDKFIELSNKLIELNKNMGNLDSFITAFDEKITMTLTALAERIELASNTIKESDKSQEKRQKNIEENRKKLKEMLLMPLQVQLSNENQNKLQSPYYSVGANQQQQNNTIESYQPMQNAQNVEQPQQYNNDQQENMSNKSLDNIDSNIVSMAGTTFDIYTLLQQYLENK